MEKTLLAPIRVLKFGGTSVEDWPAFQRVAGIVRANAETPLVVIVSAMGGVTDALIKNFRLAAKGEIAAASSSLEEHFARHLSVAGQLSANSLAKMQALVEQSRSDITNLLKSVAANGIATLQTRDAIASHGELLSANLLAMVLEQHGIAASYVDARRCILTNDEHGSASPLLAEVTRQTRTELLPLLETKRVPVLGGFIGATADGLTTTLGRGSSDYSATLISAALGAHEIQIWTDVDGVQTADPRLVQSARTVPKISYEEAGQLARLGARVIHPKMMEPVIAQRVSIQVLNSRAPEQSGTLICAESQPVKGGVKAIAYRTDLTTIDVTSTPALAQNGFLRSISEVFARHQTQMEVLATTDHGITFAYGDDGISPAIVKDLERVATVEIQRPRAIVGCVGDGLQNGGGATATTELLREIDPTINWQSTAANNLVAVVDKDSVETLVRQLHERIFERHWIGQRETGQ
jgi:aspartate kinase